MARSIKINRPLRLYSGIVASLFLFTPYLSVADKSQKIINVCAACEQKTIAGAVAQSHGGETIYVQEGLYKENNIKITKGISLIAKGLVIVDGDNQGEHIFEIIGPKVIIKGFTIKNTGISYLKELSGIRVTTTENCDLSDNHFDNTTYGIYLENSKNCMVRDNTFRGRAADEASGGNGIHLWQGENITVENNDIQGHRDGIYFEFVKGAKVISNVVSKNIRYGLHFMQSNDCSYRDNLFIHNGAGVAVMYSRRIEMYKNRFFENTGVAAYGLLLKEIHEGVIEKNSFTGNTVGIFMEGSNRNEFKNNRFNLNGWAIRIMGDCENNKFTQNDILDNTFDVATNSENNPNEFFENYWSQYRGYDLNKDGIGDISYRPVNLSSVIIENVDSSFVLVKSFLFAMLDEIERSLPELIPERMKDERPLMNLQNGDL